MEYKSQCAEVQEGSERNEPLVCTFLAADIKILDQIYDKDPAQNL